MSRAIMNSSGAVLADTQANWTDGANKTLPEVPVQRLLAALAMVLRDEINAIRIVPVVGLASRSVDDIVNAIKAKL